MARRPFLQQVAENPRGWGEAPPPVDPQFAGTGELRSGNTPYGDLIATLMGPEAGPYASSFDRGMETAANLGAELTGLPQAARAGRSVEKASREFTPANAGAAGRDVGLAALGAVPMGSAAARAGGAAIDRIAGALAGTGTKAAIGTAAAGGGLVGASDAAHAGSWEDLAGKIQKDVSGWFSDPYKAPSRDEWMAKERERAPKLGDLDRMQAEAAARVRESEAYRALASQPQFATVAPNGAPLGRATVAKRSAALQAAQQGMVDAETARAKAAYNESKGTAEAFEAGLPKRYDEMVADLITRRAEESGRPFYERHPALAAGAGAASVALPALIGYKTVSGLSSEAKGLVNAARTARANGDLVGEAQALKQIEAFPGAAGKQAAISGVEAAAIPPGLRFSGDALDYGFVPSSGDPAHPSAGDKAADKFTLKNLPNYLAATVPNAIEGVESGLTGAGIAAIAGNKIPLSALKSEAGYLSGIKADSADQVAKMLAGPRAEALEASARIRPQIENDVRSQAALDGARSDAAHMQQLADLRRQAELDAMKQPGALPSPSGPSPLPGSGPVAPASTSSPPVSPQANSAPASAGNQATLTIDPTQYQGILQALAGTPKAGPKALPSPRGREGQLDPYNTPVNGVSPADVTRDIYARAAQGGKPTTGRGGNLTKADFPEQVNAELRARTGDPVMTGLSREQLHKRRLDAEAQIDDMARREGLSYGEALQRYLQAEPTTELSGPRKGMRRNLPALSVAAPAALAAQPSSPEDNPYRRIAQSLMGY